MSPLGGGLPPNRAAFEKQLDNPDPKVRLAYAAHTIKSIAKIAATGTPIRDGRIIDLYNCALTELHYQYVQREGGKIHHSHKSTKIVPQSIKDDLDVILNNFTEFDKKQPSGRWTRLDQSAQQANKIYTECFIEKHQFSDKIDVPPLPATAPPLPSPPSVTRLGSSSSQSTTSTWAPNSRSSTPSDPMDTTETMVMSSKTSILNSSSSSTPMRLDSPAPPASDNSTITDSKSGTPPPSPSPPPHL